MLVVDDEALVQRILDAHEDIEVVGAVSGPEAVAAVRRLRPTVVLLDVRMPEEDGLTVLNRIRALPDPPVVAMLTTFYADEQIAAALRAGAAGYLLKDTEPDRLGALVRSLAGGGTALSSPVARQIIAGYLDGGSEVDAAARVARLTDREVEVLRLVAEGLSTPAIGQRLYLSSATVKDHISAILAKTGAEGRVQAAVLAERSGLLRSAREQSSSTDV